MKVIITLISFLILIGCAPKEIPPPFENSNQYFIDNTINKLNIGQALTGIIDSSQRIVLLPLEKYQSLDQPIIYMVEDQIISSLYQSGLTILERDETAIQHLIREGKERYSLTFTYQPATDNSHHRNGSAELIEKRANN